MADVEPKTPIRRRTLTSSEAPSRIGDRWHVEGAAVRASVLEEPSTGNEKRSWWWRARRECRARRVMDQPGRYRAACREPPCETVRAKTGKRNLHRPEGRRMVRGCRGCQDVPHS